MHINIYESVHEILILITHYTCRLDVDEGSDKITLLPLVAIMRRSRIVLSGVEGGGGGSRPDGQKTAWTTFLF